MSSQKKLLVLRALPIILLVVAIIFSLSPVSAAEAVGGTGSQKLNNPLKGPDGSQFAGQEITNVVDLIAVLVWAFPSVMGAAALLMVVVAGFLMVSAMGNEEKIERAKMHLFYIAVGLGLLGFAYMIIKFVIVGITTPLATK